MFWLLVFTLILGALWISALRGGPYDDYDIGTDSYEERARVQGCARVLIGYPLYYGSAYLLHYFFDVLSSLTFGWFTFILIMGHFVMFLSSSWIEYKNAKKR